MASYSSKAAHTKRVLAPTTLALCSTGWLEEVLNMEKRLPGARAVHTNSGIWRALELVWHVSSRCGVRDVAQMHSRFKK